jgi:hypothetical protein
LVKAPVDPGVRGGAPGGGSPLGGLTQDEQAFFNDGKSSVCRDRRKQQWARASFQREFLSDMPRAAGCRRVEPGRESLDRDRHAQRGKEQFSVFI